MGKLKVTLGSTTKTRCTVHEEVVALQNHSDPAGGDADRNSYARGRRVFAASETGQDLFARGWGSFCALALGHGLGDTTGLLRHPLVAVERPAGRIVRPREYPVLHLRPGAASTGSYFSGPLAGAGGPGPFLFYGGGGPIVVWLRLSPNGVHRDLPVAGAHHRRQPAGPHAPGRCALEHGESRPQRRQAAVVDQRQPVHRVHVRGLFHPDSRPGRGTAGAVVVPVGGVLGAVLRPCDLWQRRLPARADLHADVPVRTHSKCPDRHGHDGHRL